MNIRVTYTPPPVPRGRVAIEMDERTAMVLIGVLRCLGGSHDGPRDAMDDLLVELRRAGVPEYGPSLNNTRSSERHGTLYLVNEWPEGLR